MLRKLVIVAALVLTIAAAMPAPAEVICNCYICDGGPTTFCKDLMTGAPTTCANWWAIHQYHC